MKRLIRAEKKMEKASHLSPFLRLRNCWPMIQAKVGPTIPPTTGLSAIPDTIWGWNESWHELRRAFRKCEIVKHLNFTSCEEVNVVHVIVNSWQPDKMLLAPAFTTSKLQIMICMQCCQHQLVSDLSAVFVFIASVSSVHRVNLQAVFITSFLNQMK